MSLSADERDLFAHPLVVGQYRCGVCCRADIPVGRLGLTTLAHEGALYQVCTICHLSVELRDLSTSGALSRETESAVEDVLRTLYLLVRAEVEERERLAALARHGGQGPRGGPPAGR